MIQSYKEELHSARNKSAIFWFIVFVLSIFLYLFFQWYYINVDFKVDSMKTQPQSILKQFWIINVKVFPNPELILINEKTYWNWSKSIFDYGNYSIDIFKKDYIPVKLSININKSFPIYYETLNLFKKFQYSPIESQYDTIAKMDTNYLAFSKKDSSILVLNQKFKPIRIFADSFIHLGYKYFSNNGQMMVYDIENNIVKPLLSKEEWLPLMCKDAKVFHNRLFCFDIMDFIDWNAMRWTEKVTKINDNLILTSNFVYNNGNWWDWWTYEHSNESIYNPDNLVHIDNMPHIVEEWILYNLENTKKTKIIIDNLDTVSNTFEFWKDTILLWYKWDIPNFIIYDEKKSYIWEMPKTDLKKVTVSKVKWAFIFNTWNNLYLYYKNSKSMISILKWDNINVIDNVAFFQKEWKNYYMNLIQE
ncbi:MAG: hypothetical protein ACD_3C00188G0017 [uncultured bacterium (gcode 4)]|uniref:Uncharacterized protein n=1 Tax=uncultured bacterium (gcode 4) TaxID=1234023 RepID=K2F8Z8_9BACT|nr:MAG: hypothetical protein ACD_3C00188G0017 [uncultured bacterium (gcode 4)]